MRKGFLYIILLATAFLAACGTTKNTKARRFYHAVTARYNIYFNGKTSFDEALATLNEGYKESYAEQIQMYPISAQPKDKKKTGGPFDRAIEKGEKAIKLHSIQVKPAKKPGWRNDPKQVAWQAKEEYNPFLKHCWMLVGEGQFYNADFLQASATFSYIARHYATDPDMLAKARIWQARCYAEMGWLYEAEDLLRKLNIQGVPMKERDQFAAVNADYLLKDKQPKAAIPYLEKAVKAEKNHLQRARMRYLLGQLYAEDSLDAQAYRMFGKVAASSPPYPLEFAARIRQTEVFQSADSGKVLRMLRHMSRSSKNKDYLDQVYYAIGNIYLAKADTAQAIANYETGVAKATQSGMDKAILWLRLGDLYFGRRDYLKAQPCFDGALALLDKNYKDYARVAKLAPVLDEMSVHAQAIHLQDSLQELARMPEAERLAAIDKIIASVIKKEEQARADSAKNAYLAQAQAEAGNLARPGNKTGITVPTVPSAGGSATFYFYNPQAVAQGKTQFQQRWGRRVLADDWRRANKQMSTFNETGNEAGNTTAEATASDSLGLPADSLAAAGETLPDSLSNDPKSRQYYLQQIPLTPDEMDASNQIIIDAMYQIALIYENDLDDPHLAVEAFQDLEKRYPKNEHLRDCYYQVFLLALRLHDTALAEAYRAKMQAAFPTDAYTIAISDPDFEHKMRSVDSVQEALYEKTYTAYLAEDTFTVRHNYAMVDTTYPLATLLPKFMFLDALSYVQQGDAKGFKAALQALLKKYPKADVSELAGDMLKGLLRGREMMQGGVRGMIWNMRFGLNASGALSAADSARSFKADSLAPARMVLMFPQGSIDRNQLLFLVASYNFSRFLVKQLDLAFEEAGPADMLTISGFTNFGEAVDYYRLIYGKGGFAAPLSPEIAIFPITDDNYQTLLHGKTLDEYVAFLNKHFGQSRPELVARLTARLDAARKEEAEAEKEAAKAA
ncbi:MAG: tetratricopeptide repeat protein, partial [Tannerella sp.]|nr:tetratricopeptide repeat protein [Tannerella sp.]